MTTWCNGQFVESLSLDVNERGLMLGDGLFETLAVHQGKAIWLEEHLARMGDAATVLGIPFVKGEVSFAVAAILQKASTPSEVLRITLTRGPTARGLAAEATKPSLILSLNPFDKSKLPATIRLATSSICRNPSSPTSRIKTLNYMDNIMAARAASPSADDALMLNTAGNVACSTVGNIFALTGEVLTTPAIDQGILPGIVRTKIIQGAKQLGLRIAESVLAPAELPKAEAIFLTNSLRLATPVSTIDGAVCRTRDISFINDFLNRSFT